jgi:galactokinase
MPVTEKDVTLISRISALFKGLFAEEPALVRSPGRVNLIGEHTDYNNGFVLPAAINKAVYMAMSRRDDGEMHLVAADLDQRYLGKVKQLSPSPLHWPDYILGVVSQLQAHGRVIEGFNCVFGGDIPIGAGLSSSAALECATIYALNTLFELDLDALTMVRLAQKAENEFVGVKCGIMDQFASVFGRKDSVIRLDCRSLEYAYVPFRAEGIRIVLFDTGVKHSLASSEYNNRRQQCEAGIRLVQVHHPEVLSLRDISPGMLERYVAPADLLIYRRCSYVVGENARLLAACEDLEKGDLDAFGERMFTTHEGLSRDYEVSCPELDFLVEQVREEPAVLGARMMGGGFGGCTINLVREEAIDELTQRTAAAYKRNMNKELRMYKGQIESGTSRIS